MNEIREVIVDRSDTAKILLTKCFHSFQFDMLDHLINIKLYSIDRIYGTFYVIYKEIVKRFINNYDIMINNSPDGSIDINSHDNNENTQLIMKTNENLTVNLSNKSDESILIGKGIDITEDKIILPPIINKPIRKRGHHHRKPKLKQDIQSIDSNRSTNNKIDINNIEIRYNYSYSLVCKITYNNLTYRCHLSIKNVIDNSSDNDNIYSFTIEIDWKANKKPTDLFVINQINAALNSQKCKYHIRDQMNTFERVCRQTYDTSDDVKAIHMDINDNDDDNDSDNSHIDNKPISKAKLANNNDFVAIGSIKGLYTKPRIHDTPIKSNYHSVESMNSLISDSNNYSMKLNSSNNIVISQLDKQQSLLKDKVKTNKLERKILRDKRIQERLKAIEDINNAKNKINNSLLDAFSDVNWYEDDSY